MDLEEPSEKLDVFTRGPKESKTVNGVKKPAEAENEETTTREEDKKKDKGETTKTRVVYTRDDLNELRDSPASKLWPAFAEDDCVRNGIWDPEVWHHTPSSAKRCASPVEDFKRQMIIEDGIVLSPQRQSFGQGCHVPQSAPERGSQQERTKSMMSRTIERDTRDGRNRLTGRVGRGSRSIDYRTSNMRDRNRNGDRQTSPWDRNDKELKRSRDDESYSYKRGRRRHDDDEDPEWMTFGPTSISETIELRGFNKENITRQRGKTGSFTGSSDGRPSPVTTKDKNLKNQKERTPSEENKKKKDEDNDDDADFDINQFFTSDSFLQFADEPEQSNSNESRFCQFFGIGGPHGSQGGSRRSSGAEELLEYSGVSTGSPSTPHTPSPSQKFMFTPIKPIEANTKPESLSEMLEKTKLDVKPLLDTVLSSGKRDEMRIKGLKRLEEIEISPSAKREQPDKKPTEKGKDEGNTGDMTAFIKLIEVMKTSGSLPEKPQPVIPGLPSHLLPRPPSPKAKTPRHGPSPIKDLDRSTSPVEFLHHIIQKKQSPSPSQVVPQMNRSYSPVDTPLYKSVEMLRRSPSPLQSMYDQKRFSPLLTPEAFMSPSPGHPSYIHNRPMMYHDKPRYELPNETSKPAYQNQKQTPRSTNAVKPKVTPKTQSAALKDLGFMPTSVLQKIKKDQMTPKSKADGANGQREASSISIESLKANGPMKEGAGKHTVPVGVTSPERKREMMTSKDGQPLLKPTAFKPYQGTSPHSVSPLRSGVHSEPQSPQVGPVESRKDPLPSSAPVTPQRHPHAEHQLLMNLEAHAKHVANEKSREFHRISESLQPAKLAPQPITHPTSIENATHHNHNRSTHYGNDMGAHHTKRDYERSIPLPHNIHQQQQQIRRENMHYLANMARPRQTPPLAMMGGHVSPQSILGTPGMQRPPFPVPNMHQGKPHMHHHGMIPSQSLHPGNFRMMPPTRTPSGLPMQSPASLMQMMPQRHPMMYRHGHTPMHGHPGYPPMMPPRGNFPLPRPHPGYVHQQARGPNAPTHDPNPRQSPSNENALSKWFSDDVLRGMQSTTPKIPTELNSKKIMSVEDLERQQTLCTS